MRTDPGGGRWCPEHRRFECTKGAKRGGLCHGSRIIGLDRCRMHAGQTGGLAKWRGQATVKTATYGLPRQVDPATALLEEVHRTAGHVAWLGSVVAGLESDELVWGLAEEIDRPSGENGGGGVEARHKAGPSTWLLLYQAERKHLAAVSKAAIDAGASDRIVRVFEQIGGTYVRVLDRVLDRLELSEAQRALVPAVVQAELTAIATGDAGDRDG